jgi:hypothetical protein
MKIAARLALLQWQANPADPANLWRFVLASVLPGLREDPAIYGRAGKQPINWSRNPYREPDRKDG